MTVNYFSPKIEDKRLKFWQQFLSNMLIDIRQQFKAGPKPFREASNQVLEAIISSLIINLEPILLPTVVSYLYSPKNISIDSSSKYTSLFNGDYEKTFSILEEFHSPTIRVLFNRCRRFRSHFFLACQRIFEDWELIQANFNIKNNSELYAVRLTCGDEHNQGAQTSIFTFDKGVKGFVYKPVDVSIDLLMHNIFAYYENNFQEGFTPILKVIPRSENTAERYGYVELCPYVGNINNKSEVQKIYEELGKLLAFGKVFKIADGHSDNIIINTPRAVWLDLETAFHSFSSEICGVHSLERTGLLVEAKEENTMFGIVTAIQGGVIPRLNLTRPTPYNDGKDNMYIRYFCLIDVKENKNRIYLNGKLCLPEDYSADIKKGYSNTLTKLIDNKEKLLSFIEFTLKEQELRTRHLLLATACYARYIGLTNHIVSNIRGDYLANITSERKQTIMSDQKPYQDFIIENEISDICNGVIPYFYRSSQSNSLYHISGAYRENVFQENVFDSISKEIINLSKNELNEDLNFIDRALRSTSNIFTWDDFRTRFNFPLFDYEAHAKNFQ